MTKRRILQGIIPPLVTPLINRDALDVDGLHRLIERVLEGGVHGLFILGTTGEAPSLSYRLRREFVAQVCEIVGQRVPVLVGITDTSFVESLSLAEHAANAGAEALVLSTPYYFPAGQTELRQYVERLSEELPLPLVLYNMPSLTKVWFEIDTLRELASIDSIIGVKDSSGDLEYFGRLVQLKVLRPEWSFMIGPEVMLAQSLSLGGDGGVSGGANVFPKLFVSCFNAARDADTEQLQTLMAAIERFQHVYDVGKYASRHIKATKCCLSLLGICDDFMAEPFNRFLEPERKRVQEILEKLQLPEDLR